mmetsp:Transcript_40987/g.131038  ORF Transcript_40987/g.131038 Transcript_40987/m.131038 type:complete len:533 (+) Transcript_40987:39-1637(+)
MESLAAHRAVGIAPGRPAVAASRRASAARPARIARGPVRCSVIREIGDDLRSKRRSAQEITQQYLDQVTKMEPNTGSFITITAEAALAQAKALDAKIAADGVEGLGVLAGVPLGIKDNIMTAGVATTAGSRILEGYTPTYNAHAAQRVLDAGAIMVGKTNMDEFGMGSSTEASAYHVTRNPWDTERVPGGSSGGSAAAVAARQVVAALGSDTGGSIRQPSSFCGVVGLKPTYGRVSRYGLVSYASSLDAIGPMTTTCEDAAILLEQIAGVDSRDATSSKRPVGGFSASLFPAPEALDSAPLKGTRVGIVMETMGEGVDPDVAGQIRAAAAHLEALGAEVGEVSIAGFDKGLPAYYVIAPCEASSNLSRYDGVRYGQRNQEADTLRGMYDTTRRAGFGAEVKRRILMGTYALSAGYYDAYYRRAQQVRTVVREGFAGALGDFDVLLTPAAPSPAYKIGEKSSDPLAMYAGDLMTVNVNLAGLPALVLPAGPAASSGLPVGMQLIGKAFDEAALLRVGHAYEATAGAAAAPPGV